MIGIERDGGAVAELLGARNPDGPGFASPELCCTGEGFGVGAVGADEELLSLFDVDCPPIMIGTGTGCSWAGGGGGKLGL